MDVLLVVDMQEGLLLGEPKHRLKQVLANINHVSARIRDRGGKVVFVQHSGAPGDTFAPDGAGWPLLRGLEVHPEDVVVAKTLNDPFWGTSLHAGLTQWEASRVFVTGWATDFCVDACVRSAAAHGYQVVVVADCHTVSDRPHLSAAEVIVHHEYIWTNLIVPFVPVIVSREEI